MREAGALFAQPSFQPARCALLIADAEPLVRRKAVDAVLDLEQDVDTSDRLQRDWRDRGRVLAAPGISRDVRKIEELPPGVGPTQRRCDRPGRAGRLVELIVSIISIGLQNPGEVPKMPQGMFAALVADA